MGLLAGIGGCGEGLTENSAINPSDVNDTTLASNVDDTTLGSNGDDTTLGSNGNDTTLDNDSGDEPVPSPCLLAEPKDLNFAAKLCNWTWTEVLTLRSCGETPVTIVDVGLETGENLACVGYHCEYYVVDAVSPMTLGPYEDHGGPRTLLAGQGV